MATIKTPGEIERLKDGGKRLAQILKAVRARVAPGVSAAELNKFALHEIESRGDTASFLNYKSKGARVGFPGALCVSINDEVVHGVPHKEKIIKEGDVVSLDLGLIHEGLFTDTATTVAVGAISKEAQKLITVTEEALAVGIKAVKEGATTGDIGAAIEKFVTPYGYGIIRELAGHGVGYAVHEDPYIPNYGKQGEGVVLKAGMVIAIEPMLTLGGREIVLAEDKFTYKTKDTSLSAHFEHTVVVTPTGGVILTK